MQIEERKPSRIFSPKLFFNFNEPQKSQQRQEPFIDAAWYFLFLLLRHLLRQNMPKNVCVTIVDYSSMPCSRHGQPGQGLHLAVREGVRGQGEDSRGHMLQCPEGNEKGDFLRGRGSGDVPFFPNLA